MPITDQFETQQCIVYSGSYTDDVVVRSTLTSEGTTLGVKFASRIGGTTDVSARVNIAYTQRLQLVSGSGLGSSCKVRHTQTFAEDEFYFDSFLPSPASIANIDGAFSPYLQFTGSFGGQQFSSSLPRSINLNRPDQSERAAHVFFPAERRGREYGDYSDVGDPFELVQFTNFNWSEAPFPFQTKYRQLLRTLRPDSRYAEDVEITRTPLEGDFTANIDGVGTFKTSEIGSFFMCLSKGAPTIDVGRWSQVWILTGSTTPVASANFEYTSNPSYQSLNNIFWSNIPDSGGSPDLYVAIGDEKTILTSPDGFSWDVVTISRSLGGPGITPMTISGFPTGDSFSFRDCEATGVSGLFRRWIIVGDEGVIYQSTPAKTPAATGWTWVDLPTALGAAAVRLHAIATNDDDGSAILGSANVCAVGDQITPTQGTIISANQDGISWTAATGTATVADPWYDVTYVGGGTARFIAVGENGGGAPPPGIVGRSPSSTGTGAWTDITPGGADRLLSVDNNPNTLVTIAVGDGGAIWRTANPGGAPPTWASISPAGSYTGRFTSVRYVHFSTVATGIWIAVGADGEVQYSTNDGSTWSSMTMDLPAEAMSTLLTVPKNGNAPVALFCGRENFATLPEAPRSVVVGGAVQDELDVQGNFSIILMRVAEADFITFRDGINTALYNDVMQFASGASFVKPSIGDPFKAYFGFGDGFTLDLSKAYSGLQVPNLGKTIQMVDFEDYTFYNLHKRDNRYSIGQIRLHGPKIRGWRYGVYSGIPTRSKTVFRRGRFGQIRDMLEQRPYSRFFLNKGSKSSVTVPAVTVAFVSGTTAAVIAAEYAQATSTLSTNPGDSGIYDREYRSGRPFDDTLVF